MAHTSQNILWSDESQFSFQFIDGRISVYHRQGERYSDALLTDLQTEVFWHMSQWTNGLTNVSGNLNIVKYRDDILGGFVYTSIRQREYNNVL